MVSVEINAAGGRQSAIDTRCDLLPPSAMLGVCRVLRAGSRYGRDNWRLIPRADHINHAMRHLFLQLAGDRSEQHLANAVCRLLFAMETDDGPPPIEQATHVPAREIRGSAGERGGTRLWEPLASHEIGEAGA